MKRLTIVLSALALVLACGSVLLIASPAKTGASKGIPVPADGNYQKLLNSTYTKAQLDQGTYVGSYTCLGCHTDAEEYLDTKHEQFIRRPMAKWSLKSGWGVMANQAGGAQGQQEHRFCGAEEDVAVGRSWDGCRLGSGQGVGRGVSLGLAGVRALRRSAGRRAVARGWPARAGGCLG